MIKFKTFYPARVRNSIEIITATTALNMWLEENPKVEVIDWRTTPVGDHNELYITIQYKEN